MSLFSKLVVIGVVQIFGDASVAGIEASRKVTRNVKGEFRKKTQGIPLLSQYKVPLGQKKLSTARGSYSTFRNQSSMRMRNIGSGILDRTRLNTTRIDETTFRFNPTRSKKQSKLRKGYVGMFSENPQIAPPKQYVAPEKPVNKILVGVQSSTMKTRSKFAYNRQQEQQKEQWKGPINAHLKKDYDFYKKQEAKGKTKKFNPKLKWNRNARTMRKPNGQAGAKKYRKERKAAKVRVKNQIKKDKKIAQEKILAEKRDRALYKCPCKQEKCMRNHSHQHDHKPTQKKDIIDDLKNIDDLNIECPTKHNFAWSSPTELRCVHGDGKYFGIHFIEKTKDGYRNKIVPDAQMDDVDTILANNNMPKTLMYANESRPSTACTVTTNVTSSTKASENPRNKKFVRKGRTIKGMRMD